MNHKIRNILYKELVLYIIGAISYYMVEIIWRGYSHWTMAVLGGFLFLMIGGINEYISWETPIWLQGIYGSLMITIAEFAVGFVLNIKLGLDIWDYSSVPLNFMGQICIPFSLLWIIVSMLAIVLDDYLRWILFKEEKPRYKL